LVCWIGCQAAASNLAEQIINAATHVVEHGFVDCLRHDGIPWRTQQQVPAFHSSIGLCMECSYRQICINRDLERLFQLPGCRTRCRGVLEIVDTNGIDARSVAVNSNMIGFPRKHCSSHSCGRKRCIEVLRLCLETITHVCHSETDIPFENGDELPSPDFPQGG